MLARVGGDDHRLVITVHHILVDGWSMPLLVGDLLALYATDGDASGLPPVRPYRAYLKWLKEQDAPAAEAAWRGALAGVEEATLVAEPDPARTPVRPGVRSLELSEEATARLTAAARRLGTTPSTLIQCAWGLLVGGLTGRRDVLFGLTVSGRPDEIPGVESMLGLFITTVPVRLSVRNEETVEGCSAASATSRTPSWPTTTWGCASSASRATRASYSTPSSSSRTTRWTRRRARPSPPGCG